MQIGRVSIWAFLDASPAAQLADIAATVLLGLGVGRATMVERIRGEEYRSVTEPAQVVRVIREPEVPAHGATRDAPYLLGIRLEHDGLLGYEERSRAEGLARDRGVLGRNAKAWRDFAPALLTVTA